MKTHQMEYELPTISKLRHSTKCWHKLKIIILNAVYSFQSDNNSLFQKEERLF